MTITASLNELDTVVTYLQDTLPPHAIVFLNGDLASGKTTLTQAVAKSRGIESDVTSPTFSLQHVYGDHLFHYDLYRIGMDEFVSLGLFEEFEQPGWHMVEWGSEELAKLLSETGLALYEVGIEPVDDGRVYEIKAI